MAIEESSDINPVLIEFREDMASQKSVGTVRNYLYTLLEFEKFLKPRKKVLEGFTKRDVAAYITKLQKKELKSSTLVVQLMAIRLFVTFLWEENRFDDKVYKAILGYFPIIEKDNEERRALTPEEVELCLKKIQNPMMHMIFWVGINYGLRCSEYAALTVKDVDLKNRRLIIRLSKGNKTRRIKILRNHVRFWKDWLNIRGSYCVDHDCVFFSPRGKISDRAIQRYFNQMSAVVFGDSEEARETQWFTAHTLRYTFTTTLWRGKLDIYVISKLLGHSSIKTTELYLKVGEREIDEIYEKWSESKDVAIKSSTSSLRGK